MAGMSLVCMKYAGSHMMAQYSEAAFDIVPDYR